MTGSGDKPQSTGTLTATREATFQPLPPVPALVRDDLLIDLTCSHYY